jgi:hypothetical protein
MRRGLLELCLIIVAVIGIHAERMLHSGSVVGRILPTYSSPYVIAVRGNDSVRAFSSYGRFGMELQPGTWKLIFTDNSMNSVFGEKKIQVLEGQRVNLGDIRLAE